MMRHIIHRTIPIVHFLLSELPDYPSLDIVSYYLVVYLELVLLDERLLDRVFDSNDLRAIVPQDIRIFDEGVLEPRFPGHRVDYDPILNET